MSSTSRPPPGGPDRLVWALHGHAAFQYLHAGCELGVFELLHAAPGATRDEVAGRLGLAPQPARCLLLALAAMGLAEKDGAGYRNGPAVEDLFADGTWPLFVDVVRFEDRFAYVGEQDLVESLRTGRNVGLRRFPGEGPDLYHRLHQRPDLQQIFFRYMGAWTALGVGRLLKRVDLSDVRSAVDVGGGDGTAAVAVGRAHPQMRIEVIDLPETARLARRTVAAAGLAGRVRVTPADFFEHEFATGVDGFFFFHQLVIWPLGTVTALLARAHRALRPGGRVVILNSMMDDDEDGPLAAALDTAYFVALPAPGGMIYAWSDYEACLRAAGFVGVRRVALNLWTPQGVILARKE
ncbi:MAG: methyltransferase domain-containing protein [Gemmataceae bacterium]|nr:methyltransferase domain-containing protein [Gemmataceae bacterium]